MRTHKVALTLTPKDLETGGEILVGNENKGSTDSTDLFESTD